ncbi:MAG: hypothetical protein ACYTE6_15795, partial [Planctomycetota bacterium]
MAFSTFSRTIAGALGVLVTTQLAAAQPAMRVNQVQQLRQLETSLRGRFQAEHAVAQQWAQQHGVLMREVHADGR